MPRPTPGQPMACEIADVTWPRGADVAAAAAAAAAAVNVTSLVDAASDAEKLIMTRCAL